MDVESLERESSIVRCGTRVSLSDGSFAVWKLRSVVSEILLTILELHVLDGAVKRRGWC